MFKILQKIVFLGMLFILFGCENIRDDAYDDKSLGVKNINEAIDEENREKLETYNVDYLVEEQEEDMLLVGTHWMRVEADLDQFGIKKMSGDFGYKEYPIDMKFSASEVIVYADCFEIKARYKQDTKRVYFSKVTQNIAHELKTCIEAEDADQVIYSFFQHDYKIEKLKRESLTFRAIDIDAIVVFKNK
jgi:hypothetical protein